MHKIDLNNDSQLLRISISGSFDVPEAEEFFSRVDTLLADVHPGFRILTDLSNVEEISDRAVVYIERVMDICNQKGVCAVARVIPEPAKDIGFNIMSFFHYDKKVNIYTCCSEQEAVAKLF